MPITALFCAPSADWPEWQGPLQAAFAASGLDVRLTQDADPATVDYLIYAPPGTVADFAPYTRARAVLSLWAGVERIVGNATMTQPLCRMVDPGMTGHMVSYVVGHALRFHLGMDRHTTRPSLPWAQVCPPHPCDRPVAVLGTGELGLACARALAALGFPVTGWGRTAKSADIPVTHGEDGLRETLGRAEIVVTLLPRTAETENLLDARRIGWMKPGACLINPGRGALIDDDALLAALDAGHVGHAVLDVFRTEPLPEDHRYWHHPRVVVTPHIAANTHPPTASTVIAENIRRGEAGEPFLYLVDRSRGY
jgi:glyoxylate/hydroxypyruvate reductase A